MVKAFLSAICRERQDRMPGVDTSSPVIDIYEAAILADREAFDKINSSKEVRDSLNSRLANYSEPIDYEAWSKGLEMFVRDNYKVMSRWVR